MKNNTNSPVVLKGREEPIHLAVISQALWQEVPRKWWCLLAELIIFGTAEL